MWAVKRSLGDYIHYLLFSFTTAGLMDNKHLDDEPPNVQLGYL